MCPWNLNSLCYTHAMNMISDVNSVKIVKRTYQSDYVRTVDECEYLLKLRESITTEVSGVV
uniref:Uncharacterized protein n=1 Tax=Rhizophagus irregularis (strain DAOM 181602 / DAOM 197198 / MUCL 43194) TaxID=747089 RepID=U9UT33_RHIID